MSTGNIDARAGSFADDMVREEVVHSWKTSLGDVPAELCPVIFEHRRDGLLASGDEARVAS
jgi:hypothetical protein